MKFGPLPLDAAEGAIAAHSVRLAGAVIKKGTRLGGPELSALRAAGYASVIAARLEPGDVPEDEAASTLAKAVAGENVRVEAPFTGRANLFARTAGIIRLDEDALTAFNAVDEAVTLATLAPQRPVAEDELIGTVKIIPFAVAGAVMDAAGRVARPLVSVTPFRRRSVAVISTLLPGLAAKVVEKTLDITAARLAPAGAVISSEVRVPHEAKAVTAALRAAAEAKADLAIVFGASAIADRQDVIPAGLEAAGGVVERLGMPVDPGNLLLLGRLGGMPVIGAPGCARSPKENGFDWVLMRLLADVPVSGRDIAAMGAGGLLTDIVTRPHPRLKAERRRPAEGAPGFAAVMLAAGRSSRMGAGVNKLLEPVGDRAVVRRVAEAALASGADPLIVVTGHDRDKVEAALAGLPVRFVANGDYASGMASSLKAGIGAVPAEAAGAVVMLGDMPFVTAELIDRLIAAFAPQQGHDIVVPTFGGRRGHPVLWARRYFDALMGLSGDIGGRDVLLAHRAAIAEIAAPGDAAFLDVDTPDLLAEARAQAS